MELRDPYSVELVSHAYVMDQIYTPAQLYPLMDQLYTPIDTVGTIDGLTPFHSEVAATGSQPGSHHSNSNLLWAVVGAGVLLLWATRMAH